MPVSRGYKPPPEPPLRGIREMRHEATYETISTARAGNHPSAAARAKAREKRKRRKRARGR